MTDVFPKTGNGVFTGIELSEGEARLRPKQCIECRAIDLHGHLFFGIMPTLEGDVMFGMLVDGQPTRAWFPGQYAGTQGGTLDRR